VDGGGILLVALAVLGACVLLALGLYLFRLMAVPRTSGQPVPCCYRADGELAWRKGTLRYDSDRVDHFGPGGLSMRPEHRWLRVHLDLGTARQATGEECEAARIGRRATTVSCRYGDESFELSMGHQHYTALRSWLESVPPGYNVNVA